MISRRCLLLSLAIAAAARPALAAGDPAAYARALYEREIARNASADPMAPAEFDALFTPDTVALRNAPRAPNAPFAAGPKLHVFFGWGMLPGVPVTLRKVSGIGTAGQAMVIVDLTVRGAPRTVFLHLHQAGEKWLISNILYDRGDDMLTFFRKLSGQ